MRFAPRGVRLTEIAQALAMKPNTLSHHLSDQTDCGLAQVRRDGRSLHYPVDLGRTEALLRYLALDLGREWPNLVAPLGTERPTLSSSSARKIRPDDLRQCAAARFGRNGMQVKIYASYDNERGYACRLMDVIRLVEGRMA
ncbi:ArsR/SmtB family transcription factor [Paracoccus beibuensis]|uniref:ArsR/SmtB family transcription factor n=1 Tax=Paracoccus beibuensis TaxID=547602 RepID=UPI00223EF090|nr:hypothetical protein [Paracoccus beibuensis]